MTNEEKKLIRSTITMLTVIKMYAEHSDFYEETKMTPKDIDSQLSQLHKLYLDNMIKSQKASDYTNKYNKEHKEYHNIINSIYRARKTGNKERLAYWQQKLEEYRSKGGK